MKKLTPSRIKLKNIKDSVKFTVDEKNRVVIAEYFLTLPLENCSFSFAEKAMEMMDYKDVYFKSKARCNERDSWDEELGKEIAYRRLEQKVKKYFLRLLREYQRFLTVERTNVVKLCYNLSTYINKMNPTYHVGKD